MTFLKIPLLVLLCLQIAVPRGLCCVILRNCTPPTKKVTSCCKQSSESRPEPQPAAPKKCCCELPDATTPDLKFDVDAAPIGLVEIAPGGALTLGAGFDVHSPSPPTSSPLHVLHCLWLC